MNLIPELESVLEELTRRFGAQLKWAPATQPNELHLHAKVELAGALCSAFHKIHNGRLVGVFAEDARTEHNAYFVYYLYVLDWAHGFVLVRVALPPDHPELPSVTNAVHGVDWQEREIQDMFGISLLGHPNPRRCVLHDDWPEVYPLRKDFNLRAQLPPFTGPRHKFREVEGEGVFQVPVGPVHAGIIEPGHFLFSVAGEPVLYLQLRLFYVHRSLRAAGGEHLRRLQLRPRHRLLPRRRARRRSPAAAARPRPPHSLPGTGAPLQPRRRHRRDLHRRRLRHRQHARHAPQRARVVFE
jgi:Ni,Fe-hydrogenase III component G